MGGRSSSDPGITLRHVRRQVKPFLLPSVTALSRTDRDPFKILISCILSLRTKDEVTVLASERLFIIASTPRGMLQLSETRIAGLIYPVGFYRRKAAVIRDVSRRIIADFSGRVPDTREGLLSLKGVGRKTANLVLGLGFAHPAICVDTHVHRISNRLGWVSTRTPEETEKALETLLARRYWIEVNTLFVAFGRYICKPVSPLCSRCRAVSRCCRRGVERSR